MSENQDITKTLTESGKFADSLTIQFHANLFIWDFIGAEVLRSEDGGTYVTTKQGVFLKYIEKVKSDPDKSNKYLLVIDELNRGNIAEIFGESILALDRNYEASLSKRIWRCRNSLNSTQFVYCGNDEYKW